MHETDNLNFTPLALEILKEELIGFLKGNIIKYTLRANHKGTPEKDKAKALQYKKWLDTVLAGDTITI